MSITVEANMRIPGLTVRSPDQPVRVINNSSIRFTKLIEVPAIPKPGDSLDVTISSGFTCDCTVTRVEWHDDRDLFVVSCNYAKRSISPDEYNALSNDSDWTMKQLP